MDLLTFYYAITKSYMIICYCLYHFVSVHWRRIINNPRASSLKLSSNTSRHKYCRSETMRTYKPTHCQTHECLHVRHFLLKNIVYNRTKSLTNKIKRFCEMRLFVVKY